jgi:hypothetical protein
MGISLLKFVAAETRASELLPSKWTSTSVPSYSGFQAVFTEPLPSKGPIRHNMFKRILNFVTCLRWVWHVVS